MHFCLADKKQRSITLHRRVHQLHQNWPVQYRSPDVNRREANQLNFKSGGRMAAYTAQNVDEGIGASIDSLHLSEVPLFPNAAKLMDMLEPAMDNRRNCYVIAEFTPYEAGREAPSAEFAQDLFIRGVQRKGRWMAAFFPFWDSLLNRRAWRPEWKLTLEELRLLERFGPEDPDRPQEPGVDFLSGWGLRKENLAFRRYKMESARIKRNPELFWVWYPKDPLTCWLSRSGGVIPSTAIHAAETRSARQVDWEGPRKQYKPYRNGSTVVIQIDPTTYATQDHAAYHAMEVWSDKQIQVACFADHAKPNIVAEAIEQVVKEILAAGAQPYIAFESQAGGSLYTHLVYRGLEGYIMHRGGNSPGFFSTTFAKQQQIGWLIESLEHYLHIYDTDTYHQLSRYNADDQTAPSQRSLLLNPDLPHTRRHHYDKVSALLVGQEAIRQLSLSPYPATAVTSPNRPKPYDEWNESDWERWERSQDRDIDDGNDYAQYRTEL